MGGGVIRGDSDYPVQPLVHELGLKDAPTGSSEQTEIKAHKRFAQ